MTLTDAVKTVLAKKRQGAASLNEVIGRGGPMHSSGPWRADRLAEQIARELRPAVDGAIRQALEQERAKVARISAAKAPAPAVAQPPVVRRRRQRKSEESA